MLTVYYRRIRVRCRARGYTGTKHQREVERRVFRCDHDYSWSFFNRNDDQGRPKKTSSKEKATPNKCIWDLENEG